MAHKQFCVFSSNSSVPAWPGGHLSFTLQTPSILGNALLMDWTFTHAKEMKRKGTFFFYLFSSRRLRANNRASSPAANVVEERRGAQTAQEGHEDHSHKQTHTIIGYICIIITALLKPFKQKRDQINFNDP